MPNNTGNVTVETSIEEQRRLEEEHYRTRWEIRHQQNFYTQNQLYNGVQSAISSAQQSSPQQQHQYLQSGQAIQMQQNQAAQAQSYQLNQYYQGINISPEQLEAIRESRRLIDDQQRRAAQSLNDLYEIRFYTNNNWRGQYFPIPEPKKSIEFHIKRVYDAIEACKIKPTGPGKPAKPLKVPMRASVIPNKGNWKDKYLRGWLK